MKKHKIIVIWTCLIGILLILANTIPLIEVDTKEKNETYRHPEDNYTLELKGKWQIYKEEKKELTLLNPTNDCSIFIRLEVGGYDYLSPIDTANKLIKAIDKKDPVTINDGPSEGYINTYLSSAFVSKYKQKNITYFNEMAILFPENGIRCYVSFVYPESIKNEILKEGQSIIRSITFADTESLFPKYIS